MVESETEDGEFGQGLETRKLDEFVTGGHGGFFLHDEAEVDDIANLVVNLHL